MVAKRKICVRVWFNEDNFPTVVKEAEDAGFRKRGLLLFTQRPHGFIGQTNANTDGLSAYLKNCRTFFQEQKDIRLKEAAAIAAEEKALLERKKRIGQGL